MDNAKPKTTPVATPSSNAGKHPVTALQQIIFLTREARPAHASWALNKIETIAVSALTVATP